MNWHNIQNLPIWRILSFHRTVFVVHAGQKYGLTGMTLSLLNHRSPIQTTETSQQLQKKESREGSLIVISQSECDKKRNPKVQLNKTNFKW